MPLAYHKDWSFVVRSGCLVSNWFYSLFIKFLSWILNINLQYTGFFSIYYFTSVVIEMMQLLQRPYTMHSVDYCIIMELLL